MDLERLNQHLDLIRRLKQAEALLSNLRARAEPGAQVLTGMPHAPGYRDRVGDLAIEIVDVERVVNDLTADIERSAAPIRTFIDSIPDSQTRIILRLHFLRGLTWREVAEMMGRKYSQDTIRQTVYRCLKNHNGCGATLTALLLQYSCRFAIFPF